MKLSQENLTKVFNYVSEQIEDDKGRGEFDKDTLLLSAVSRTIEMIEDNQWKQQLENIKDTFNFNKVTFGINSVIIIIQTEKYQG